MARIQLGVSLLACVGVVVVESVIRNEDRAERIEVSPAGEVHARSNSGVDVGSNGKTSLIRSAKRKQVRKGSAEVLAEGVQIHGETSEKLASLQMGKSQSTKTCKDTPGWSSCTRKPCRGMTCATFARSMCKDGAFVPQWKFIRGPYFNNPEEHCCVCGGGTNFLTAACGPGYTYAHNGYWTNHACVTIDDTTVIATSPEPAAHAVLCAAKCSAASSCTSFTVSGYPRMTRCILYGDLGNGDKSRSSGAITCTRDGHAVCSNTDGFALSTTYPCACGTTRAATKTCTAGQRCTASSDDDGDCHIPTCAMDSANRRRSFSCSYFSEYGHCEEGSSIFSYEAHAHCQTTCSSQVGCQAAEPAGQTPAPPPPTDPDDEPGDSGADADDDTDDGQAPPPAPPSSPEATYTERPLVASEGHNVAGSISPLTSLDACKQACTSNPRCKSFALCQSGPSGCWMKNKVVTMSDISSYSSHALNTRKCKTWFKGQGDLLEETSSHRDEFATKDDEVKAPGSVFEKVEVRDANTTGGTPAVKWCKADEVSRRRRGSHCENCYSDRCDGTGAIGCETTCHQDLNCVAACSTAADCKTPRVTSKNPEYVFYGCTNNMCKDCASFSTENECPYDGCLWKDGKCRGPCHPDAHSSCAKITSDSECSRSLWYKEKCQEKCHAAVDCHLVTL